MGMAICMVELTSIARGIETSDDMIKAAQVTLLRGTTVCPGKYMVIVGGETGAVRAALEAGLAKGGEFIVDSLLIPNVHEQLFPAIAGTQEVVDEVESQIEDGSLHVFDTATWTVDGKTLDTYEKNGIEYISDGYFHESEYGSAPAFDIIIDGIDSIVE